MSLIKTWDALDFAYFDLEVYPEYFLIEVWFPKDNRWIEYENPTFAELAEIINIPNLVAFFNHNYDDSVLMTMYHWSLANGAKEDDVVDLEMAKAVSNAIVNKDLLPFYDSLAWNKKKMPYRTFDVLKYAKSDMDYSTLGSLKAFMNAEGLEIIETPISFNTRPTNANKALIREYCRNDVKATFEYFKKLIDRKVPQALEDLREMVANEVNCPIEKVLNSSANSLVIKLFEPELANADDSQKYQHKTIFEFLKKCDLPHLDDPRVQKVLNYMLNYVDNKNDLDFPEPKKFFKEFGDIDGYVFGLGGIHYQNPDLLVAHNTYHSDVASLYPSLTILLDIFGVGTPKYKNIVNTRLEAKHSGDKVLSNTLKIVINATYGLMRSLQSGAYLYNEYAGLDICIAGQMILYSMSKELEKRGAQVVQTNTDGVIYSIPETLSEEAINVLKATEFEYEIKTGLVFETDIFAHYYAKDVNNYFILDEDMNIEEAKGTFNKKVFANNQAVGQIVIDYFKNDLKSFQEYLEETPEMFLCRAKTSRRYEVITTNIVEMPRYSAKTGRLLKGFDEVCLNQEPIGRQLRGYPVVDGLSYRKIDHNTGKVGAISNVADKLEDTVPPVERLDKTYFTELIIDLINKITPLEESQQQDVIRTLHIPSKKKVA